MPGDRQVASRIVDRTINHGGDVMNVILIMCDTWRLDHCGPYNRGKPLNECWSKEQPNWVVPTPNLDRLAVGGIGG